MATAPSDLQTDRDRKRPALAVADAGWFTTENLFREVPPDRASTLLLRCADVRVAWQKGQRPWSWNRPAERVGPGSWSRDLVLPTGWMKTYPTIGMRPIARAIRRWKLDHAPDGPLTLAMTYPYYLHLADRAWPDRLVYFNIDDYRLYWPKSAEEVGQLERRAVLESDLTVCTSLHRAEELRREIPAAASRIRHLPHGAPSASIPDGPQHLPAEPPSDIAHLPRPLIGYVGTLEDRVNWRLDGPSCRNEPNRLDRPGRPGRRRRRIAPGRSTAGPAWRCRTSTRSAGVRSRPSTITTDPSTSA